MRQLGHAASMLKGINLGWKASEAFSEEALKTRSAKNLRENRLRAAIRRMQYRQAEGAAK